MGVYGWVVDAQFVIALGDNFYNDGTESTEDELWETAFHDVYAAPSLDVPWYGVLGNHGKDVDISMSYIINNCTST
jgi:tartrate-resistant acid phosphatase type 5